MQKRQSKTSSNSQSRPPTASGSLMAGSSGQFTHTHPSYALVEGSQLFLSKDSYSSGVGQVPEVIALKQNKRAYIGLTAKADDKPCMGCVTAMPPWKKVAQAQAHCYKTKWVRREAERLGGRGAVTGLHAPNCLFQH